MKLKMFIAKINQVENAQPLSAAEKDTDLTSPEEVFSEIRKFLVGLSDVLMPTDVMHTLQGETTWTSSTIKSIKYYLRQQDMDFFCYVELTPDDSDPGDSIMTDVTRNSGILLLDNDNKYMGFLPRGYFYRFDSESDANPATVYNWVFNKVRMFPEVATNYFKIALDQSIETQRTIGIVPAPAVANLNRILNTFEKQIVII